MILYMSLLISSIILGILIPNLEKNKKLYLLIIFLILALISGLRDKSVGLDTYNYTDLFFKYIDTNKLTTSFQNIRLEKGYILLNYIIGIFTDNAQAVLMISSLFINYSFARLIYKYSNNVAISTVIYIIFFYQSTMNTMRQYIALSIFFFGIDYLLKNEKLKYLLIVVLASQFHSSAWILIVLIIVTFGSIMQNRKVLLLLSVGSIIVMNYFNELLEIFVRIFPVYQRLLVSDLYTSESQISILWMIIYAAILILGIHQVRMPLKERIENSEVIRRKNAYNVFLVVWHILFIISYVFSNRIWIANRILVYFKPVLILIVPSLMVGYKFKFRRSLIGILFLFLLIIFAIVWSYTMFITDPHGVMPYRFFLE
ncbi:EpsG family protein [Carnobacterium sp. 1290_CSPC]|uniref:EpsG family protein n=1 Tax=Carnobacterium sp. 1290_CSPC TaxID=1579347 RepID=UPI00065F833D|nr:EpsG family protein [Carnobacterium sp. 1290_CSPC]